MSCSGHDIVLDASYWEGVDPNAQVLVDRWLVEECSSVTVGQPLVRVMLAKSNIDVPAPAAGVLERTLVPPGDTFGAGRSLGTVRAG